MNDQNIREIVSKEKAKAKLEKAGLPVPSRPAESETLLQEWEMLKKNYGGIGNIPYVELGMAHDKFTSLLAYARWVEAIADIDLTTAKEIRDTVKKQLYIVQEGPREMKDARVYNDPLFLEWEQKYLDAYATYALASAVRETYEMRVATISREITRRGQESSEIKGGGYI